IDAAVAQRLLARRGPASVRDRLAGEVDDQRGPVELLRELPGGAVRGPADARDARLAGARLVLRLPWGERSGEHPDVVPLLGPRPGERVAEEARAAGDDHLHGEVLDEPCPREVCADRCTIMSFRPTFQS